MLNLFKKEILGEKNWILGFCGFVIGINLLFLPLADDTGAASVIPVIFLTLSAFPLMAFVKSFLIFKDEWDRNNNFLLLTIPERGYKIVLSKLGAISVEIFAYILLALLLPYFVVKIYSSGEFAISFNTLLKIWLLSSSAIMLAVPFAFFSYLLGRAFAKNRGWITVGGLIAAVFLHSRYLPLGRKIFSFIPEITLSFTLNGEPISTSLAISTFFAVLLFDLFLLWGGSYFLENAEM